MYGYILLFLHDISRTKLYNDSLLFQSILSIHDLDFFLLLCGYLLMYEIRTYANLSQYVAY